MLDMLCGDAMAEEVPLEMQGEGQQGQGMQQGMPRGLDREMKEEEDEQDKEEQREELQAENQTQAEEEEEEEEEEQKDRQQEEQQQQEEEEQQQEGPVLAPQVRGRGRSTLSTSVHPTALLLLKDSANAVGWTPMDCLRRNRRAMARLNARQVLQLIAPDAAAAASGVGLVL
jgi:hypothetical protein